MFEGLNEVFQDYLGWIFCAEGTAKSTGIQCPECSAELEDLGDGYLICPECLRDEEYDED